MKMKFIEAVKEVLDKNKAFKRCAGVGIKNCMGTVIFFNPMEKEQKIGNYISRSDVESDWQEIVMCPHCNQNIEVLR